MKATSLPRIIQRSSYEEIESYLEEYPGTINEQDRGGNVALHIAVFFQRIDILKLLLSKGANANIADNCGYLPIHLALKNDHIETTKILTQHTKLNSNQFTKRFCKLTDNNSSIRHLFRECVLCGPDEFGVTILSRVDSEWHFGMLLQRNISFNSQERESLDTPLHKAARNFSTKLPVMLHKYVSDGKLLREDVVDVMKMKNRNNETVWDILESELSKEQGYQNKFIFAEFKRNYGAPQRQKICCVIL